MRTLFILLSFFVTLAPSAQAENLQDIELQLPVTVTEPSSPYKYKIWLWPNALQVQVSDSATKVTAITFVKYSYDYSIIHDFEYEITNLGSTDKDKDLKFLADLSFLKSLLMYIQPENIEVINIVEGARDFDFSEEYRRPTFQVFPTLQLEDEPYLHTKPIAKELDLYRFKTLVEKVLVSYNIQMFNERPTILHNICMKYLAN